MKELRTELEQAEFEARAWYDKFRRLYARMVKANEAAGRGTENDTTGPEQVAPDPAALRPLRSRRGF